MLIQPGLYITTTTTARGDNDIASELDKGILGGPLISALAG